MTIWNGLSMRRRAILAAATIGMFVAILALARISAMPQMVLLYAGLDSRAAGEVIAALDQRGTQYRIDGDAIMVPLRDRDALRMALAGEGLPAQGSAGYEILDQLSGFGTTSEMFDAAYWRAKEGELARTILALPGVRKARVHLARGPSDAFRRPEPPTASVTLTTSSGRLPDDQALALRHLVAAAVSGMRSEDVQIIDTVSGLIGGSPAPGQANTGTAEEQAENIRQRVERLLSARVGPGNALVEVSIDLVTQHEHITERSFDPQSRVAISSEVEEKSQESADPGAAVTVASNLPEGNGQGAGTLPSRSSESRERVNFEVSEVQRELQLNPGGIRRMTVAVLVDGQIQTAADGSQAWMPRPEEELSALRELVASAVGLDEARGDALTLKSMELQSHPSTTEAALGDRAWLEMLDPQTALQLIVLALVALGLGLFVIRPILLSQRSASAKALALPMGGAPLPSLGGPGLSNTALTGEIDSGFSLPDLPVVDFASAPLTTEAPAERLRRLVQERQAESMEILRGWLDPEEGRA